MRTFSGHVAVGAALVLIGGLATSVPASADQDPTVTVDDGVVEFVDPALADEDTDRLRGTLRLAYVEGGEDHGGDPQVEALYAIETDDGDRIPVELAEQLPASAANGDIVADVVDDGSGEPQVAEATVEPQPATEATSGKPHKIYVAMPTTSGALPADADVRASLGAAGDEWSTEAEGAIGSVGVARIVRYSSSFTRQQLCAFHSSAASVYKMWDEAAKKVGWKNYYTGPDSASIDHLVLVLSGTDSSCLRASGGTLGIGVVGDGVDTDGTSLSVSWRADKPMRESTLVHELGHNFGLGHGDVHTSTGEVKPYYNLYSVMGFGMSNGSAPALDSAFRDQLGFVQDDEVVKVPAGSSGDRTVTLAPRGSGSGTRAVQVVDTDGRSYWVEYRSTVDRDTDSVYGGVTLSGSPGYTYAGGVTVSRLETEGSNTGELLLSVQPESGGKVRTSYAAGEAFSSPSHSFSVRVESIARDRATVTVTGRPYVVGTQRVGRTLTVRGVPSGSTRQWLRDGYAVRGAAASTFKLTAADRGARISVRVAGPEGSIDTNQTWRIQAGVLKTRTPKLSGHAKRGRVIKVTPGWGTAPVTYRYQWHVNSRVIKGATTSRYTVPSKYVNQKIRVRVVGTKAGYTSVARWSTYSSRVRR